MHRTVYESLVEGLLANGTTHGVVFWDAPSAPRPRSWPMSVCDAHKRALIGRVAMDDIQQCPPYYRDPSAAVAGSRDGAPSSSMCKQCRETIAA